MDRQIERQIESWKKKQTVKYLFDEVKYDKTLNTGA